jgi:hypothetical protein
MCNHAPPRVLQHRILPPNRGGLQGCHVPRSSGTLLPAKVGSDVATRIVAPDPRGGL